MVEKEEEKTTKVEEKKDKATLATLPVERVVVRRPMSNIEKLQAEAEARSRFLNSIHFPQ